MAGIYIHVPFCKQKCIYCDFHFSTSLKYKSAVVAAMKKELELKKNWLEGKQVNSIYFGGGTPSLLSGDELKEIVSAVHTHYDVSCEEMTIEVNPDDITAASLEVYKEVGFDRLSMGMQSFYDEDLQFFKRGHTSSQSLMSLSLARAMGWKNISVDLIFGHPLSSLEKLETQIVSLADMKVPHVSIYGLTVESKTELSYLIDQKKLPELEEEKMANQYAFIMEKMQEVGYEQYEISNFAMNKMYAKHNTNYWRSKEYLGVGPSAHSMIGGNRFANISNNILYVKKLQEGMSFFEEEVLAAKDRYNEYIMTRLRTVWGVNSLELKREFGEYYDFFVANMQRYISSKDLLLDQGTYHLSSKGKVMADRIISDAFFVD